MDTRDSVIEIIHAALRSLNDELTADKRVPVAAETRLFGTDALLDSLSLVSRIVDVESGVSDRFAKSVSLTDDEAMGQAVSPFASVAALTDYVVKLLARG
jgi:acyl carrier protein